MPDPYISSHDETVNFRIRISMAIKSGGKGPPRDSGKGPSSIAGKVLGGARATPAQARILAASVLSQNQKS